GGGVNFTAGLPIVRTSPDHGSALNIAGNDKANPQSFVDSVIAAVEIVRNRNKLKR
ncbi:MAG: 4-hydroxythreonine-4-phosphate dehydrogenase PdxA, partial [Candidatus Kapaibacterium sp.]